jgi:DNA polymerase-3 subunit delta
MAVIKDFEFRRNLDSNKIAPCYILYGTECALVENLIENIKAKLNPGEMSATDYHEHSGEECPQNELAMLLKTVPLLEPHRMVVIRQAERLRSKYVESLKIYAQDPNPTSVLVLVSLEKKLSDNLKSLKEYFETVVVYPWFDDRASRWVHEEFIKAGKRIEQKAVRYLLELSGGNTDDLIQEVKKLLLYVGEHETCFLNDAIASAGHTERVNVFALTDALKKQDKPCAIAQVSRLLECGEEPLRIMGVLSRFARERVSLSDVKIMKLLRDADYQIKSSKAPTEWVLERVVITLTSWQGGI